LLGLKFTIAHHYGGGDNYDSTSIRLQFDGAKTGRLSAQASTYRWWRVRVNLARPYSR